MCNVHLSKTHKKENSQTGIYDLNTKAATGMIHAGLGERSMNNFLSVLNLNTISPGTLKMRENEIGEVIEKCASESQEKWTLEEVKRTIMEAPVHYNPKPKLMARSRSVDRHENRTHTKRSRSLSPLHKYDTQGLGGSSDAMWQKRGAQTSYNSLSGASTLCGIYTRKVINSAIRIKRCRKCSRAERDGKQPFPHKCRKNWTGSAKAMEPDMLCEMVRNMKKKKFHIQSISGDDDNTGFARAKATIDKNLVKRGDKNHTRKNVTKKLYALKNTKKHKELSVTVIMALTKYFNYMITQNQNNVPGIKRGLKAIVAHAFGDHKQCSIQWCKYLKNKDKHRNLPRGKPLQSPALRAALEKIFIKDLTPKAEMLATLSSSQPNESFNSVLVRKAPKINHYSESASLSYRLAASITQKNEGYSYVAQAHEKAGLSPGFSTKKRAKLVNKDRDRKIAISQTNKFRRRRLELKACRSNAEMSCEVREGDSYQSNIMMDAKEVDYELIPQCFDDNFPIPDNATEIVFDLETTGLKRTSEIIQIAAQTVKGDHKFSVYSCPVKAISNEASDKTKFTKTANQLYHKDKPVETVDQKAALEQFVSFLDEHKPVVLVGHNIKSYDLQVLFQNMGPLWSSFSEIVCGCVDTKSLAPSVGEKRGFLGQEVLVKKYLKKQYEAHNAIADVESLCELWEVLKPKISAKTKNCLAFFLEAICPDPGREASFEGLVENKIISKFMAGKICKSGLHLEHLKKTIGRNGIDGLFSLLAEKRSTGKPRCTESKHIVKSIFDFRS